MESKGAYDDYDYKFSLRYENVYYSELGSLFERLRRLDEL